MGKFILDGICEIVQVQDLKEKEGLKVDAEKQNEPMFMKLKIAKFLMKKIYQPDTLQDLLKKKKKQMKPIYD